MKKNTIINQQKLINLVNLRGHKIINGNINTKQDIITLYCYKHQKIYKTTFSKYERDKFGITCCSYESAKLKISKAHKGKPKKYTSWLKGKTGPNHPSYKHGLRK